MVLTPDEGGTVVGVPAVDAWRRLLMDIPAFGYESKEAAVEDVAGAA